jgi:cytochrome P450
MNHGVYYCLLAILPLVYFLLRPFWKKTSIGSGSPELRLPPGPWKLPVIGSIHHLICSSLAHHTLRDLSLRHGPLMFLKFGKIPVVVASTPEAAKEFMKTHDAIFSSRPVSLAMKIVYKDGPGIVFSPYDNHWRQVRKICMMELLSAKRVQSFRPAREEEALRLVQTISSTTAPLIDFGKLVSMYSADVSVHTILGRRFKDKDTLVHKVEEVVQLAGRMTLEDLFPPSFLVRALSHRAIREIEACQQSLFTFMDEVIREHQERKTHNEKDRHQENMIDVLLKIQQEGNIQLPLTMRTIEAVIFVSVWLLLIHCINAVCDIEMNI